MIPEAITQQQVKIEEALHCYLHNIGGETLRSFIPLKLEATRTSRQVYFCLNDVSVAKIEIGVWALFLQSFISREAVTMQSS